MKIRGFQVSVLLLLAAGVLLGQTQSTTGTIAGTVLDPSGAAVPNATVAVMNTGTGIERQVKSDADGRFQFPALTPGSHVLHVRGAGIRSADIKEKIEAGKHLSVTYFVDVKERYATTVRAPAVVRAAVSVLPNMSSRTPKRAGSKSSGCTSSCRP